MAARRCLVLLACAACLVGALGAPVRNQADCVSNSLLAVTGSVYPTTHQISRPTIQERTTVTVAQNFEIAYGSTYKIVNITFGSKTETYVLFQCGTTQPDLASIGLPASTKVFSVPLMSVSAPDTSLLSFMKLLGVQDRVSYVTSYAVDSCMQLLATSQCGRSTDSASSADVAAAVDASFTYSVKPTNPQAVAFSATAEYGPLRMAEYVKYVAAFFNKEAQANKLFAAIYTNYDDLYSAVQNYVKSNNVARPVVAWLYYVKAYPEYNLTEQIAVKFHGYRPQFTGDAGGQLPNLETLKSALVDGVNVVVDYKGDLQLNNLDSDATKAALKAILSGVDIAVDESFYEGDVTQYTVDGFLARYRLASPTAATDLPFLASKRLLRLDATANPKGSTAWFEEAVARPDLVLHDLVYFITPAVLKAANDNEAPHLVRNLFPATTDANSSLTTTSSGALVVTSASCPVQSCSAAPKAICPAVFLDCSGKLVTASDSMPCPPTCANVKSGDGGAAGMVTLTPGLLLALLAVALMAVIRPAQWGM